MPIHKRTLFATGVGIATVIGMGALSGPAFAFEALNCDQIAAGSTATSTSNSTDSINVMIGPSGGSASYSGGCKVAVVVTDGSASYESSWGTGAGDAGSNTESVGGTQTVMTSESISDGSNTVTAYVWNAGSGLFNYNTGSTPSLIRMWIVPTSAPDWTSKVVGTVTTSLTSASSPSPGSSPTSSSASAAPGPWLQQFETTVDGQCTNAPENIYLGTTSRNDGWSQSWAQWPRDYQGGWVCTRTLEYDPATQGWVVS